MQVFHLISDYENQPQQGVSWSDFSRRRQGILAPGFNTRAVGCADAATAAKQKHSSTSSNKVLETV